MKKGNGEPGGVNLIDPQAAGTSADQKDYLKRKEACLKECSMIEKKYNIRLGAEVRFSPFGVQPVFVTYDVKKEKAPVSN